jgi:primosomal protein N' (replication factor Y)
MSRVFADVIIDISLAELDRTFSYEVPEALKEEVRVGSSVIVPFGKSSRLIRGFVTGLGSSSSFDGGEVKEIREVVTDGETAMSELVQLADWMHRHYGSTMNRALHTVFPTRKKIAGRLEETVTLTAGKEESRRKMEEFLGRNCTAKARILACLLDEDPISRSDLVRKARVTAAAVHSLEESGDLRIESSAVYRSVISDAKKLQPDVLTQEQEKAVREIEEEWSGQNRPSLLFGVTGSGKTLVYMELIDRAIREGKQAIVLIPEIALTYQTVLRFVHRFGKCVSFLNSRLSEGERYDQFKAAKCGDVKIMVGPRSALFTPFPDLGLIVIDEEHENTYRSENVPRYHARETAVRRAEMCGAHVVMGSATPSLTAYYRCMQRSYRLVTLKERYGDSILPKAEAVDMKEELKAGNRSILSRRLYEAILDRLKKKQQIMLFLNRRGYAGFVTCRSCGHVVKCPHCDVSLTQHRDGTLVCHYCGYTAPMVRECPECHSKLIGGIRIGTEQVETEMKKEFPEARILRMDTDTTKGKEGHRKILKEFADGEADILIGTQMIVKGHDFPNVTLVGVLMADLSLNESDYGSAEHTFQLVTQAIGRCGRGKEKGLAVVQTYQPDHYAIEKAVQQDYEGFYREEIAFRDIMDYPPSGAMAAILGSSQDEARLSEGMAYLMKYIGRFDTKNVLSAIGPAPMAVGKIKDRYRQIICIRNRDEEILVRAKDRIEKYISVNRGFDGLSIQFDFNM